MAQIPNNRSGIPGGEGSSGSSGSIPIKKIIPQQNSNDAGVAIDGPPGGFNPTGSPGSYLHWQTSSPKLVVPKVHTKPELAQPSAYQESAVVEVGPQKISWDVVQYPPNHNSLVDPTGPQVKWVDSISSECGPLVGLTQPDTNLIISAQPDTNLTTLTQPVTITLSKAEVLNIRDTNNVEVTRVDIIALNTTVTNNPDGILSVDLTDQSPIPDPSQGPADMRGYQEAMNADKTPEIINPEGTPEITNPEVSPVVVTLETDPSISLPPLNELTIIETLTQVAGPILNTVIPAVISGLEAVAKSQMPGDSNDPND